MGLCIAYDRLMCISTGIANKVIARFEQDGVVCPPTLRTNIFTSAAVDNIDHNPSATTAKDSFHGTAISLVQHPTNENKGDDRGITVFDGTVTTEKKIAPLPDTYHNVPPSVLPVNDIFVPQVNTSLQPSLNQTSQEILKEYQWLDTLKELVEKEKLEKEDSISWAAFHASKQAPKLRTAKRVDVIWDVYLPDSLKAGTREKRGSGTRRRVLPSSNLPKNWKGFLRVNDNKTELFHFLANQLQSVYVEGKEVYTTYDDCVLSSPHRQGMSQCSHEEADTRIMLHAQDACQSGHKKIAIRTNDTDVVVLAISMVNQVNADEIWLAFGTGKTFRYLAAHQISAELGENKAKALPMFHALTAKLETTRNLFTHWKRFYHNWENYGLATRLKDPANPNENKELRTATFLTCLGSKALDIFDSLDFDTENQRKDIDVVIDRLEKHCIGKTNETYKRYIFNQRVEEPNETVDTYVTALKTLAKRATLAASKKAC
ncbi:hypothetical protein QZH41_003373 [Actinostola sp. cb2023]|nr:hypothetical protein QZH41_003373 [Actinostola sp. cb2023]